MSDPTSSTRPAAAPAAGGGPKLRAQDYAAKRDWPGYFGVVYGKPARETLVSALARFEAERALDPERPPLAVDLGCGEGRDALELLRRGWRVEAIDGHPSAFELLLPRVPAEQRPRLRVQHSSFAAAVLPRARLVNSSYSLPFCEPEHFASLWSRIVAAIEPGGRFAGQFFGERDDWARLPDRSHQTLTAVRGLLSPFEIEELREEEKQETDAEGIPKHWHVFHVVARRVG